MIKTLFLFGAGASRFCGKCADYFKKENDKFPPLGADLFSEMKAAGYIPNNIHAEIIEMFEQEGFEPAMNKLAERDSTFYNPLQRNLASYLSQFYPAKGNLYERLIRTCKSKFKTTLFATLNYDNLIELTLAEAFKIAPVYGANDTIKPKILKLHGGIGLVPDAAGKISGVIFGSGFATNVEAPVKVLLQPLEILNWMVLTDDSLAPVMAMYMKGKPTKYCRSFVNHMQAQWTTKTKETKVCYLIGVRLEEDDEHIWKPLLESDCEIRVADPDFQPYKEWAEKHGRANVVHFANTFEECVEKLEANNP